GPTAPRSSCAAPITWPTRPIPRLASSSSSSRRILVQADGSWKIAVPMLTIEAPASINSSASVPVITPPMPIIGTSGSAARTCQMHRTAMGLIAGPDKPPVRPARAGRIVSVSIATPRRELIIESPSAPAETHERAIATMSVTSGESLAKTGRSCLVLARTASITAPASTGSHANTCPRCSTFGQEMFTSSAVTPAASEMRAASSAYSSTVLPAIDTTARAPRDSSHGRSRCKNASMPGPCSPMEFSIPLLVSAILGVGRPALGASITDLVTTAPILETSMNWASSRPELAQPDAVSTGLGNSVLPSRTRRSGAMAMPPRGVGLGGSPIGTPRGTGPRRGPNGTARGVSPHGRLVTSSGNAPYLGFPPRRAERVERDRADVVPADLLTAEHRPVHAGPDHPGDPVAPDNRQHAGHADTDTAGHRLLDGYLDRNVVPAGQRRHLPQHRHRTARIDDVGAGFMDGLSEHVGHDAADAKRAVDRGNRGRSPGTPGGQRAEHLVAASRAEQEVDRAAPLAQPVGQGEQRRAAVAAADQEATYRVPWHGERAPERPGQIKQVPGPALGQPPGSAPVSGEHELDRSAVVRANIMDGESSPQQHRRVRAANRHGNELAWLEPGRDAGSDDRDRMVSVDLAHGQHRAAHLHRARFGLVLAGRHGRVPRMFAACCCSDRTPTSFLMMASIP